MYTIPLNLLLADDDMDDCIFFKEALEELPIVTTLTTVNDGEQLLRLLAERQDNPPDVLYLDLNMPRKNGFECLVEVKLNEKLKQIPVIIFSSSLRTQEVDLLHEQGANYYIRKPAEFSKLKKIISKSLHLLSDPSRAQAARDNFLIPET